MIESWMVSIGAGAVTFIATFATLRSRHIELEKKVCELNDDSKKAKELIFRKIDELRETTISHKEKIASTQLKVDNLDEKFMTDKEVEAKYLQKLIFEAEMKRINERFNHLEKKLDDRFDDLGNVLKDILDELKKGK